MKLNADKMIFTQVLYADTVVSHLQYATKKMVLLFFRYNTTTNYNSYEKQISYLNINHIHRMCNIC